MEEERHDFGLLVRRVRFTGGACGNGPFSPRPSLALTKFWQGRVELALRILCLVSPRQLASYIRLVVG